MAEDVWGDTVPFEQEPVCYMLGALAAIPGVERRDLGAGRNLFILKEAGGISVDVLMVEFVAADEPYTEAQTFVRPIFKTSGPSGNLREMRHTYFAPGEDGYLFYAPWKQLAKAMEMMGEWFD